MGNDARQRRIEEIGRWFDETNARNAAAPALLHELVGLGLSYTQVHALTGVPRATVHGRVHAFTDQEVGK